ncbi:hypothetical protein [Actinacidiphila acidipaludis]|uniref:Secreted protein n=1 Tax=Actinacidiphila acidipaludis TaxID=2873382 RepID=A0ABS7Q7V0_9ACTN|nr:hypothetical protein [Streptomyces acidipaludis]MBY8879216.1 hypothetical protein [Streptomyces acidipaludis]
MRRGLLHVGAWALTTAAAVTLSWFGVRSVLHGTAYDPPRALPIAAPASSPPQISATHRPRPTTATPPPARPPASAVPPQRPPGTPKSSAPAGGGSGDVHPYGVRGGRVVLDLQPASASLVSATPNSGWQMQVWTQDGWLRVTFTSSSGTQASSVFCTWNGHAPSVQTFED